MYMKQGQILQIREAVEEIHKIASMETCNIDMDAATRRQVKLWAMWFSTYAYRIEEALDGNLKEKYL